MVNCLVKEMFAEHLDKLSALSTLYVNNPGLWIAKAHEWLTEAEKLMSRFRFPEGALIAAARGNISKADDIARSDKDTRRQASGRIQAAAQTAIDEAAKILSTRAQHSEEYLESFKAKLCEMTTAYLIEHKDNIGALTWQELKDYHPLRGLCIYMETALGLYDRDYLLQQVNDNLKQ